MPAEGTVLEMWRGDDYRFDVFVENLADLDPCEKIVGEFQSDPIDVTGTRFWFTAKDFFADDDSEAVIVKDITDGISILDAVNGQARVFISKEDTEDFVQDRDLKFDVQWEDPDGGIHTITWGVLKVLWDVTQRRA